MSDPPEIIEDIRLLLNGYVYVKSRFAPESNRTYWDCKKVRSKECKARAITTIVNSEIIIIKGPKESPHAHPPNREEGASEKIKINLKRKAESHPSEPPSRMLRSELEGVPGRVLAQLPDRENLKKSMRRARRKNLPPNPTSLAELKEIPEQYKKTATCDKFLIFDSRGHDESGEDRVLVFATKRNVELLATSSMWFLDGTFKVSPAIFTQLFTILGTVTRTNEKGDREVIPLPFVYALLSSKSSQQYALVLRAVVAAAAENGIENCRLETVMSDFELAIINACTEVFPDASISTCFFHLGQSLYRKIQQEGLQVSYNDPENTAVKDCTHMIAALAFVPIGDVECYFARLKAEAPATMQKFVKYFDETYVSGKPKKGRRKAVPPKYPLRLWNQFNAVIDGKAKTNNASEGWHNRFHLLMGKVHPDLYTFLQEIIKEQGDTEISFVEFLLHRKVKAAPRKKWLEAQSRLRKISLNYEKHDIMTYLEVLGQTIVFS